MIAEYLASDWPFILPPALFIAGIAVGVKWHRKSASEVRAAQRRKRRRIRLNTIQRSADAYAKESRRYG